MKGKDEGTPPSPPLEKKQRSYLHPFPGVNIQSFDLDPILQSKRVINEVNLNLQEELIDADINHNQGAVCTPGLRGPHHI